MIAAGIMPNGRANRVCHHAQAQGYFLRFSLFASAAAKRLRHGDGAITLHCGINL